MTNEHTMQRMTRNEKDDVVVVDVDASYWSLWQWWWVDDNQDVVSSYKKKESYA